MYYFYPPCTISIHLVPNRPSRPTNIAEQPSEAGLPTTLPAEQPNEAGLPSNLPAEQPSEAGLPTNLPVEQPVEVGLPTNLPAEQPVDAGLPTNWPTEQPIKTTTRSRANTSTENKSRPSTIEPHRHDGTSPSHAQTMEVVPKDLYQA
jgi:hypothetical protein